MQIWRVNLRPSDGPLAGSVFHFELVFPDDYPSHPPTVHLMSTNMPGHPNVFGSGRSGFICLSMLREHTATEPNEGWTSAYTCFSLLLQLQSFLFAENIPQDYGGNSRACWTDAAVASVRHQNRRYRFSVDAETTHTHDAPWPPLPPAVAPADKPRPKGPVTATAARIGELQRALRRLEGAEARAATPAARREAAARRGAEGGELELDRLRDKLRGLRELQKLATASEAGEGGGSQLRFKDAERLPLLLAGIAPLEAEISTLRAAQQASDAALTKATLHALEPEKVEEEARAEEKRKELKRMEMGYVAKYHKDIDASTNAEAPCLSDATNRPPLAPARASSGEAASAARARLLPCSDGGGRPVAAAARASTEGAAEAEAFAQAVADARLLAVRLPAVGAALPEAEARLASRLRAARAALAAEVAALRRQEEAAGAAAAAEEGATGMPELPSELWLEVFDHLRTEELPIVGRVCRAWRDVTREYQLWTRRQLRCYHTKLPFGRPGVVLGVGLQIERHHGRAGTLRDVHVALDLLSEEAFTVDAVRTSVWKAPFSAFLPLALEPAHFERAVPALRRAAQHAFGEGATTTQLLDLLAAAMNSMVVALFRSCEGAAVPQLHASEAALEGYCALHHLLLRCAQRWPDIGAEAYRRVRGFVDHEHARRKSSTPDLGRLLVCLTLAGRGWEEMRAPFVSEMLARNVRWVLQLDPQLGDRRAAVSPTARAARWFAASRTSKRLVAFQIFFLRAVGRPAGASGPADVLAGYERRLGRPTASQRTLMQATAKKMLALSGWQEFFELVGAEAPAPSRLNHLLLHAVDVSARRRYHHPWDH